MSMRWPSLDACKHPEERKGPSRHHVNEDSLVPRSEQDFRRTHVPEPKVSVRIRRLTAASSKKLLLQPRQRRPLCMPQCGLDAVCTADHSEEQCCGGQSPKQAGAPIVAPCCRRISPTSRTTGSSAIRTYRR